MIEQNGRIETGNSSEPLRRLDAALAGFEEAWRCADTGETPDRVERLVERAADSLDAFLTGDPAAAKGACEERLAGALERVEEDGRSLFSDTAVDPFRAARLLGILRIRGHVLRRVARVLDGQPPRDEMPFLLAELQDVETGLRRARLGEEAKEGEEAEENGCAEPDRAPADGARSVEATGPLGQAVVELRELRRSVLTARAERRLEEARGLVVTAENLETAFRLGRSLESSRRDLLLVRDACPIEGLEAVESLLASIADEKERLFEASLGRIATASTDEERRTVLRLSSLFAGEVDEARVEAADRDARFGIANLRVLVDEAKRFLRALRGAVGRAGEGEAPGDAGAAAPDAREMRRSVRRFRRMLRRARNLWADRVLRTRLERILGRRGVEIWEGFIFWLIMAVLGLIVVDHYLAADAETGLRWTMWVDTGICGVLLLDFFFRLALAPRRGSYFLRNFLTEFVPSIPFGLIANLDRVGAIESVRVLRLVRVFRVMRFLRPVIRIVRLLLFVLRAFDRVVERNVWLLNRNIVFFTEPVKGEGLPPLLKRARELDGWIGRSTTSLFLDLPAAARAECAVWRLRTARAALRRAGPAEGSVRLGRTSVRAVEMDSDDVIRILRGLDETQVEDALGTEVARQITASLRLFRLPILRRLPVVRFVLGPSGAPDPLSATARLGRVMGDLLDHVQRTITWFSDLYGTVTGSQFLDRVGVQLIRATARPARRLVLFVVAAGVLWGLVRLSRFAMLEEMVGGALRFLSTPVLVLGVLCFVPLAVGIWFRRIAGQAVDFFERVAEAQFLALTEVSKETYMEGRLDRLAERVVLPEAALRGPLGEKDRRALVASIRSVARREADAGATTRHLFDWSRHEFVLLFWRDFVDGAWFHRNDTKVAHMLLGNLTLENIRERRLRYSRREKKRLERLDIARVRGGVRGPDKWFGFITHSVAQQTARLVIEYNQHCIPLEELDCADPEDRALFEAWLGTKGEISAVRRSGRVSTRGAGEFIAGARGTLVYRTTEFNALHFLTVEEDRDAGVRSRYGKKVAEYLAEDREYLVRDIFGTYPMHELPKEKRTFNPYDFYRSYVSRGRIFFLPIPAIGFAFRGIGILARRILAIIRDVLHPEARPATVSAGRSDFEVARRKLHRMRRPVVMEAVRMRALFDVEYLGIAIPGRDRTVEVGDLVADDLRFLNASELEWEEFRELKERREQQLRLLAGLLRERDLLGDGFRRELVAANPALEGREGEAMRALVTAFLCDHENVCTVIEARERLRERLDRLAETDPTAAPIAVRRRRWRPGWSRRRIEAWTEAAWPHFAGDRRGDASLRLRFARAMRSESRDLVRHLENLAAAADRGSDLAESVREALRCVAEQPSSWTEQMIAARTVQTLGMIDLLGYEETIRRLGAYPREPGRVTTPFEAASRRL